MSLENVLLDVTIEIVDKDKQEKAGQLRYIVKESVAEVFDTYLFPGYRRQKIMSSLIKKIIPELRVSGVSKIRLQYLSEDARIAWERMGFRHASRKGYMELHLKQDD